jgi:16S rRNA U516 pseudouridylate synthase RsuA-like enzyme
MDEEVLNLSVRKFLKQVGVTSQREIEKAIRDAVVNGDIDQDSVCKVSMQLTVDVSDKPLIIDGEIHLS